MRLLFGREGQNSDYLHRCFAKECFIECWFDGRNVLRPAARVMHALQNLNLIQYRHNVGLYQHLDLTLAEDVNRNSIRNFIRVEFNFDGNPAFSGPLLNFYAFKI